MSTAELTYPVIEHEGNVGRITDCTKDVVDQICEAVLLGLPNKDIAAAAGISPKTYYQWLRWGKGKEEPFKDAPVYEYLVARMAKANKERLAKHLANIADVSEGGQVVSEKIIELPNGTKTTERQFAKGDWRASAWILERTAKEFAKVEQRNIKHSGKVEHESKSLEIKLEGTLNDADAMNLNRLLSKVAPKNIESQD